jgi:ATP-dependent Clp protease adaptor protein ClpS
MSEDQALRVMISAHRRGVCIVAVYTKDVAEAWRGCHLTSNDGLRRYSAEGGLEATTVSLPSRSLDVIVAFGSVWITGTANDELCPTRSSG